MLLMPRSRISPRMNLAGGSSALIWLNRNQLFSAPSELQSREVPRV